MRFAGMKLNDWYLEARYQVRRVASFFVRGRHGVSQMDTWSFDHYLATVMARGFRMLAEKPNGVPMFIAEEYNLDTDENGGPVDIDKAVQCWQDWLINRAEWLEWYVKDEVGITPEMSDFEKTAALNKWDIKYKTFKTVILPDIAAHFDALWD